MSDPSISGSPFVGRPSSSDPPAATTKRFHHDAQALLVRVRGWSPISNRRVSPWCLTRPARLGRRWRLSSAGPGPGLDVVQSAAGGRERELARRAELETGDLVVALGGDGTVLAALRAAAPHNAPVLGVACGSLGALTSVHAERLEEALQRVHGGDWTPRRLPALRIDPADAPDEWALNDFVGVPRWRAGGRRRGYR